MLSGKELMMSESEIVWDEKALEKLEKVPVFIRKMVKGKIEKAAMAKGSSKITPELMDEIRKEESGG
jgi:hypothetical protein